MFIFQSRIEGVTIRAMIGDCEAWDIHQARTEAWRLQTLIGQGIDPRTDKADKIAVREAQRTETQCQDATLAEA